MLDKSRKDVGLVKSASFMDSPIPANMPFQEQAQCHWQQLQRGGKTYTGARGKHHIWYVSDYSLLHSVQYMQG